jgi:LacI family transcriptional regulator
MPFDSRHVTLAQVAAAAGVTVATASYALRNSPKISRATAARVMEIAARLGYRPDPRIASLMAHIRKAQPVTHGEQIAFIWIHSKPGIRTYPQSFEGALARALQLGFGLTEFWLSEPEVTPARLAKILKSRGIAGVVLSPLHDHTHFKIDWDWTQFSAAVIGNAPSTPELHHAGHHHFSGMRLALQKAREHRPSRIAAALDHLVNERAGRSWSAAFIEHHPSPASARKHLALIKDRPTEATRRWLEKLRPGALITTQGVLKQLRAAEIMPAENTRVILLDWHPNPQGYAGVDTREDLIAANAIDMVVAQLQCNERGAPEQVKMLLLPGVWQPGGAS